MTTEWTRTFPIDLTEVRILADREGISLEEALVVLCTAILTSLLPKAFQNHFKRNATVVTMLHGSEASRDALPTVELTVTTSEMEAALLTKAWNHVGARALKESDSRIAS